VRQQLTKAPCFPPRGGVGDVGDLGWLDVSEAIEGLGVGDSSGPSITDLLRIL
jgi:hypothetical protein